MPDGTRTYIATDEAAEQIGRFVSEKLVVRDRGMALLRAALVHVYDTQEKELFLAVMDAVSADAEDKPGLLQDIAAQAEILSEQAEEMLTEDQRYREGEYA